MIDLETFGKPLGAAIALGLLWAIEGALPMFEGREKRLRHGAPNLLLGVANAGVSAAAFAAATLFVTEWARARGFGVLNLIPITGPARLVVAVLLFDLWQYFWHRLNHTIPLLWRFHAVHHADAEMDASTALRFHTGEIVLSSTVRLAVLPLLGLTIAEVLVYETILLPIILFHHSNVRLSDGFDRSLRWLIVTPWMHWVHHSDIRRETDSNYSSMLSVWDRLFGSFRLRTDPQSIRLGLKSVDRAESRSLWGMLAMPFRRQAPRDPIDEGSADS